MTIDAKHQVFKMRCDNFVVNFTSVAFGTKKTAVLHKLKVLAALIAGNIA